MALPYYLNHFAQVLSAIRQRYGFLLSQEEHAHIARLDALSEPALSLYVRLVNRKGPCFRQAALSYAEIPSLDAALTELLRAKLLLHGTSDLAPELRPAVYRCFTIAELIASLRRHGQVVPRRKQDLLAWLAEWDGVTSWLQTILADHSLIYIPQGDPWPFFRFLFFGDLRDNLSDFVVKELGHVVTEDVDPDQLVICFRTRQEAVNAYRMATLYAQFRILRDRQSSRQTMDWWLAQHIDRLSLTSHRNLFDRLVGRLGRGLEREGEIDAAMTLYATSPVAPARERLARLLIKLGRRTEALTLLDSMIADPSDTEEGYIARQLLNRLDKRVRRSTAREYQKGGQRLAVCTQTSSVEEATLAHYRQEGWSGVHSENWLWNAAFGLLFWDIIYDATTGAFHSPLQLAPTDLYDRDFYHRRQGHIEKRLDLLRDRQGSLALVERHYRKKSGLANPFVYWQDGLLPLIEILFARVPSSGLAAIFRRLAQDIKAHAHGFPDLFLWTEDDYRFVEVKSPNDQLSPTQYQWLQFFCASGVHTSLDNVRLEELARQ